LFDNPEFENPSRKPIMGIRIGFIIRPDGESPPTAPSPQEHILTKSQTSSGKQQKFVQKVQAYDTQGLEGLVCDNYNFVSHPFRYRELSSP
jgi:hypothetical protein